MGNIAFSKISQNVRVPLFYIEFSAVNNNLNQTNQQTLIIGQTVIEQPLVPTFCSSYQAALQLFGANSMLADMVKHYLAGDSTGTVYVLPLADSDAGVAASGTIIVTGTATSNGSVALYVAGTSVPVPVTSGQVANTIAANISAAVNAAIFLPVIATVTGNTVTLTAVHAGTLGNTIDVRTNFYGTVAGEVTPPGVTLSIVALNGGANNPDLSTLGPILGDDNYDFIVSPYTDPNSTLAMSEIMNDITGRWSWNRQDYGAVFSAHRAAGTGGGSAFTTAMTELIELGDSLNDPRLTILGYYDSPNTPWQVASEYAAVCAASLKADPARPLQTLQLPNILPPALGSRMGWSDQNTLLNNGIALGQAAAGNVFQIVRAVTTYQLNSFGVPDQSYLDIETEFTLMYIARKLKGDITQKYARSKLGDNGTSFGFGSNIVTPNVIRAELISSYQALINDGVVEDSADFAKGLIVQRNPNDASRVDVLYDPILISGLRVFAVLTQFALIAPPTV